VHQPNIDHKKTKTAAVILSIYNKYVIQSSKAIPALASDQPLTPFLWLLHYHLSLDC